MLKALDYSFLNQTLAEFLLEKGASLKEIEPKSLSEEKQDFNRKLKTLVQENLLTQAEVDTLILGLKNLSPEKLMLIAGLQTEMSALYHNTPLQLTAEVKPKSPIQRAIDWTLIHVQELGLPGVDVWGVYMDDFWEGDLYRVGLNSGITGLYHQCHWCGRLDFDHNDSQPSHKIKKTQKYCHAPDCKERNNSNPSHHVDCCLGQFGLLRRRYKERFRYQGQGVDETEQRQRIINNFKIYCEERFHDNLTKEIDVVNELTYHIIQGSQMIAPVFQSPQYLKLEKDLQAVGERIQQALLPIQEAFAPLREALNHPQLEETIQQFKAQLESPEVVKGMENFNALIQKFQDAFKMMASDIQFDTTMELNEFNKIIDASTRKIKD